MDGPSRPIAGSSRQNAPTTKATGTKARPVTTRIPSTKYSRSTVGIAPDGRMSLHPTAQWDCPQCTLVNEAHRRRCAACDLPRPEDHQLNRSVSSPSLAAATPGWTCPRCTLFNTAGLSHCAACDAPPPNRSAPPQVYNGADGWTCAVCGEAGMPNDFWSCSFCGSIKAQS